MNRRSFIRKAGLFVPATFAILVPGKALADDFYFNFRRRTAGGALGFTFIQGDSATVDGGTTAQPLVGLTSVTAGSLIVYGAKYEDGSNHLTAVSDGTNSFTLTNSNTHSSDLLHCRFAYLLSSSSGTKTYTPTFDSLNVYKRVFVAEFSYSGSLALDTSDFTADGSGTALASGAITTTAANALVCGLFGHYAGVTFSSKQIGGVNASNFDSADPTDACCTYRILTGVMTTGTAVATASGAASWVASIISFNVT